MFSMQGTLVDTSPTELWLRLSSQVATGTLTITGPRGDGRVRFAHGDVAEAHASGGTSQAIRLGERLVHAGRLDRPDLEAVLAGQASASVATPLGSLLVERGLVSADIVRVFLQEQALEAMTTMVGWTQGRYSFEVGPAAGPRVHLSLPVRRALMELQRRSRERELIRVHVPGPSSVPLPQEDQAQPPRLTADAFTILTAVDGLRTVGAIAASLGYSYEEASRVIYRLVLQGLVTIAETHSSALLATQDDTVQTSSTTPPTTPLDDQGWFERRDAVRAEEPEPWVGFANATPPPPATPASEPAPQAPAAAASATAEPARVGAGQRRGPAPGPVRRASPGGTAGRTGTAGAGHARSCPRARTRARAPTGGSSGRHAAGGGAAVISRGVRPPAGTPRAEPRRATLVRRPLTAPTGRGQALARRSKQSATVARAVSRSRHPWTLTSLRSRSL
jgi:hypothetical protein